MFMQWLEDAKILIKKAPLLKQVFRERCAELKNKLKRLILTCNSDRIAAELLALNTLLVNTLLSSIDNEIIIMESKNLAAQETECINTYDKALHHFEQSIVEEKHSNRQGSKVYADALGALEAEVEIYDTSRIDEHTWLEVRKQFFEMAVSGAF